MGARVAPPRRRGGGAPLCGCGTVDADLRAVTTAATGRAGPGDRRRGRARLRAGPGCTRPRPPGGRPRGAARSRGPAGPAGRAARGPRPRRDADAAGAARSARRRRPRARPPRRWVGSYPASASTSASAPGSPPREPSSAPSSPSAPRPAAVEITADQAPEPHRSRARAAGERARGQPAWLPWVVSEVAALRGEDTGRIARQTERNARRLFGLPMSPDPEGAHGPTA